MLQILIILIKTLSFVFCDYQIMFDAKLSPPVIVPVDIEDYIYSVPLNQMISKPIIAYINFINGTRVTTGPLASEYYHVATVDATIEHHHKHADVWATSGGELCQKTAWWLNYPRRLNRKLHKVRCGSKVSKTILMVKAIEGTIIIDWIYHKHNIVPHNKRVIHISLPEKYLTVVSNPFAITPPAHHLEIITQPPMSVYANQAFRIVADIKMENGSNVEMGLDSIGNVDLTIPYYLKTFSNIKSKRMLLQHTPYRLSGEGAILHQGNYDWYIRKRAVRGRVTFVNITIIDPGKDVKLNLTMTMVRDPWQRIPNCETCYADLNKMVISEDGIDINFLEPDSNLMRKTPSVRLTRSFEVKHQILHKLIFSQKTMRGFNAHRDPVTKTVSVVRNVVYPGRMEIIATDIQGKRIFSGDDSVIELVYMTIPKSVCISSDVTDLLVEGKTSIKLSICQIINNVTIEIIPAHMPNASVFTPAFSVEGKLNIAHFGDFRFSGDGAQVQSHVNSFIRFAAYDINKGIMMPFLSKQGFSINIITVETKSDMLEAYKSIVHLERKILSRDRPSVIITSTRNAITRAINPELLQLGAAIISTSNTNIEFSDNDIYPLFNRVCWNDVVTYESLIKICQARNWNNIIILRQIDTYISELYISIAKRLGVEIKAFIDINFHSIRPGEISLFKHEMELIKSLGVKIIILLAQKSVQPYILRAAQIANIDSLHGYQLLLYGSYAWQFPFANEGLCQIGVPCTKAFASTYLVSETYNISGYQTKDWVRVLGYHFAADRYFYKGGRVKYRPPEVGAKMALGYDSVLLYARVIEKIVLKRESITPLNFAKEYRGIPIKGLTGDFELDENGDRIGFFGFLAQINPFNVDAVDAPISMVVTFTRALVKLPDNTQLEIPYKAWRPGTNPQNPESKALTPISPKYNIRVYKSISGLISQLSQTITKNPSEPWPSIPYTREEKIAPTFTCDFDCGMNILSPEDVNLYDTGECVEGGRCVCKTGFHGNFCDHISCKCKYGTCISATHCQCHQGWRGLECNIAICEECKHGECIRPDNCKCSSRLWVGGACKTHIALILAPLFLGSVFSILAIALLSKYIMKHSERNAALSNNDWIIEWPYVTQYVSEEVATSKTSLSDVSSLISQRGMHIYIWKNEKWFGKAINSKTIDPKIKEMRLEMVDLVKLRHRNLIRYGGACLTSPNVCLFLEVTDKGSLNDILLNDSIDIGWEFKFSFLKDICTGMKFLHEKTQIGSHGRLKSHNCLIDGHWTVRISGFGAHTIRFGRFRLPSEQNDLKQLFWTAPELLDCVTSLDDVKNGTVSGDTYSFAIIIAEILTRAEPYDYELEFISEKAIYDLITDTDSNERKAAYKTWGEIGGASMFNCRPIIREEFLPESGLQKKQFLKMLDDAWNENPSGRPNFDKLLHILNQIHPVKGELIDNLLNLLESYSTNLEMIVAERTKELEVNKARAEQLLSQMLPRKVTAELKLGRKVPPEIFPTATVFFSDIVDFAMICQESSPFQIVDFLNETYNAFDEVLDHYDVYKVETISDSYMVVSGVPESNGLKHASEISTMALDLMSTVTTFIIPHKPKATLQLRIGINSGPVVAGVVGILMPRYCLFGDTVNTASRMESSSQALHIQLSDTTADILDEMGGFELESRGKREVKGRGLMTTYWLWGKDGFNKPMPDQSQALSLSKHKFK